MSPQGQGKEAGALDRCPHWMEKKIKREDKLEPELAGRGLDRSHLQEPPPQKH